LFPLDALTQLRLTLEVCNSFDCFVIACIKNVTCVFDIVVEYYVACSNNYHLLVGDLLVLLEMFGYVIIMFCAEFIL